MVKIASTIVGIVVFLLGALWSLQGLGVVRWPSSSFMLFDRDWAVYGVIAMAVGAILLWLASTRGTDD